MNYIGVCGSDVNFTSEYLLLPGIHFTRHILLLTCYM